MNGGVVLALPFLQKAYLRVSQKPLVVNYWKLDAGINGYLDGYSAKMKY